MFSNLAIDKPYDQQNAGVKDDGGAVGLTGCSADQRWHVSLLSLKDESLAHCARDQECRIYSSKM